MPIEKCTWEIAEKAARKIAHDLKPPIADGKFKNIYGPPRGGMCLAVMLSHLTGLPVITNKKEITLETLIVDDIADTGNTLDKLLAEIPGFTLYDGVAENVATIYAHPKTTIVPGVWLFRKGKAWVVFPWELEK